MKNNSGTFTNNMKLPVHRWFRYSAGFSAEWVSEVLESQIKFGRTKILDPFVGSGTTLIEASKLGIEAIGLETHPFVYRIAKAKLNWVLNPKKFLSYANKVIERAIKTNLSLPKDLPNLLVKSYNPEKLKELYKIKEAIDSIPELGGYYDLLWLALTSILRITSSVKTSSWTYILPNTPKNDSISVFDAFSDRIKLFYNDMIYLQSKYNVKETDIKSKIKLFNNDARDCDGIEDGWVDFVITSPPYANNFDYADATRLEMTFFGEVKKWGDLQETVRKYLMRSCTQHVSKLKNRTFEIMNDPILFKIKDELIDRGRKLDEIKETKGGKKNYHTMIATYFHDMARVLNSLKRVTNENSLLCFVIGDSAPYGIHIPVERWLGELAVPYRPLDEFDENFDLSNGVKDFRTFTFEKLRVRNNKWDLARKHKIPLKEGILWIE